MMTQLFMARDENYGNKDLPEDPDVEEVMEQTDKMIHQKSSRPGSI